MLLLPNFCIAGNVYMSKEEKNQLKYDFFVFFKIVHRSQLFFIVTINIIRIY